MNFPRPNSFSRSRLPLLISIFALAAAACGSDDVAFDDVAPGAVSIVEQADIEFAEISPFATFGSAQGNFGEGPHGTFGIFGAGAASPPHTHSGAYYAVVLSGDMNNPFGTEADPPTLTPGSFWSVPANDEHVTACLDPDSECRFFFHADSAFDFAPIETTTQGRTDAAASIPADELDFESLSPYDSAATVWGDPDSGPYGSIVRMDPDSDTGELTHRNAFALVPMSGGLRVASDDTTSELPVGSLLQAEPNTVHELTCSGDQACEFYLFSSEPREIRTS